MSNTAVKLMNSSEFRNGMFSKFIRGVNTRAMYGFDFIIRCKLVDGKFVLDQISFEFYEGSIARGKDKLKLLMNTRNETDMTTALKVLGVLMTTGVKKNKAFISITMNYGKKMNHQCALVKIGDDLLFYEPYGTYTKFGKDYFECLKDIGSLWQNVKKYHEFLKIEKGIQTIILEKNNEHAIEKGLKFSIEGDPDLTTRLVYVGESKQDLDLYNRYSSKICVSITLVELSWFFKDKKLNNLYDFITKAEYPTTIIVDQLNLL